MQNTPWSHYHANPRPLTMKGPDVSVPEALDQAITTFGSRTALEIGGTKVSFAQLGTRIRALAQGLLDIGIRPGDRVALIMPMSIEAVVAFHATLRIGAIAVAHSAHAPMAQLSRFFDDYQPQCAIVVENRLAALDGVDRSSAPKSVISVPRSETPHPVTRVRLGGALTSIAKVGGRTIVRTAVGSPGPTPKAHGYHCTKWKDILASPPLPQTAPYPDPHDLAVIMYPARGPAKPLGAMLTHGNLMAIVHQSISWLADSEPGTETSYAMWPLHSVTGIANTLTTSLIHGRHTILFPRANRTALLRALKKNPPTVVTADSSVFAMLAELARQGTTQASGIRFAFTSVEDLASNAHRDWAADIGEPIVVGYGSAESMVVSGLPVWAYGHEGSVGVPFPSTQVRVVDPEQRGRVLPRGEVGLLMVKGPQVFHGYWNKPDETSTVLSGDGWLLTQDLASIDDEGFVTLASATPGRSHR